MIPERGGCSLKFVNDPPTISLTVLPNVFRGIWSAIDKSGSAFYPVAL